ncbi:Mog1p/PsbP-like protein [Decorospora gaudefroyi]|uniref:Mog1p/PsbP-like protein n=1 Tax=Decorospora gaudefroyi TaxID=184978 RepID=A0A6A5KSS9_9PLEO|nr:Mog1p/PsbP-like protein [Decorospora gaudefroyi]
MQFTTTPLFGGAITVRLPSTYTDASQIRQIPSHQEVYLDSGGYSSIVTEILEYVDEPSDEAALQYHFADLVDGCGDETSVVDDDEQKGVVRMERLPNNPVRTLTFLQTPPTPPSHPTRKTPEFTYIHLLLLRLKDQATDIIIQINTPHYANEYEKPSEAGAETELMRESKAVRDEILKSFEIREWGLFGGE